MQLWPTLCSSSGRSSFSLWPRLRAWTPSLKPVSPLWLPQVAPAIPHSPLFKPSSLSSFGILISKCSCLSIPAHVLPLLVCACLAVHAYPSHPHSTCEGGALHIAVTPCSMYTCFICVPLHAGKPLSKCGKCKRYMKYISQRPSRLYCPSCEEVYPVPQVGCLSPPPLYC